MNFHGGSGGYEGVSFLNMATAFNYCKDSIQFPVTTSEPRFQGQYTLIPLCTAVFIPTQKNEAHPKVSLAPREEIPVQQDHVRLINCFRTLFVSLAIVKRGRKAEVACSLEAHWM